MARFDNEQAVIGSVLIDPRCAREIDKVGLSAEDFSDSTFKLAFEVMEDFRQDGKELDPVLIADEMSKRTPGDFTGRLFDCMVKTVTAANMQSYCKVVKDNAAQQKIVDTLRDMAEQASLGDWKAAAQLTLETLSDLKTDDRDLMSGEALSNAFLRYFETAKADPDAAYCRTGFQDLDRQLGGGMFRSEVYIIGARPGMGKTTIAINIAQNIVRRGGAVLFVSLEMSEQQIMAKRISLETGVRYTQLMTGRISEAEEEKMREWLAGQKNQPFFLTTRNSTTAEIFRRARQIQNLNCIIVDYIGLISCQGESRQKPRYEQMTEISASLKAMAKMLKVPILALCQLNRENVGRGDKRPTMADLRDSGAIEQDAGGIILLHRPDYYTQKEGDEKPEMEVLEMNVAKNRHAEVGTVRMWWHGNIGKIMQQSGIDAPARPRVTEEEELPF